MNAVTTQPQNGNAVRAADPNTPAGLQQQLEKGRDQLRMALPAHIDPEKFQRTVITAAQANPDLLRADRQSLFLSIMKCAQDGLLPDGREAALVIFNNNVKDDQGKWVKVQMVQYMPMVYGLRKKIVQSGEVRDITAKVVYRAEYERGTFLYEEGTEAMLRHKPDLLLSDEEATDDNIVAAYSIATYMDGTKSYEVMSRAEINKVRQVSKTGAVGMKVKFGRDAGKEIEPKGPWVDWFGEMAKKTVMRRHAKTLPMSGDLLDVEGREADEQALIAGGATRLLASQDEDERVPLPSRGEDLPHDPDTGEIVDQESEQAIAEKLDSQTFNQAEGTVVDDDGDPGPQPDEREQPQAGESEQVEDESAKLVADFIDRCIHASTIASLNKIDADFQAVIGQVDDAQYQQVKQEIAAAETRLKPRTAKG